MKHRQTGVVAWLIIAAALTAPMMAAAQSGGGPDVGFGATFGVSTFENPTTGEVETYQLLGFRPDFALGNFGIGLNLPLNYRFTGGETNDQFEIRQADWVPDANTSFLELYLPKFRYVRYGTKGEDLFVRFGSFSDATLGNGFIVSNYSNERFLPERRIFGGSIDLDGELFGFPYLGIETLVANVAAFDLLAARLYTRPFAWGSMPLLPSMQIGLTVAQDSDPYYFAVRDPSSRFNPRYTPGAGDPAAETAPAGARATVWGVDVRQPILGSEIISLAAFADAASMKDSWGGMVGAGGRLLGIVSYGAQLRLVGDNFVPSYFDTTYDRRRIDQYNVYNGTTTRQGSFGYLGRLGFVLFEGGILFDATVSGPLGDTSALPQLSAQFRVAEGMVPGFAGLSFDAYYEKFNINSWEALVSPRDAIIGARFNIASGPVVISLVYDLIYDPLSQGEPWTVTSSLESTISF